MADGAIRDLSDVRRHALRSPSSLFFTPFFTSQVAAIHLRAAQMNLLAVRARQIKNVAVTALRMDTRRDPPLRCNLKAAQGPFSHCGGRAWQRGQSDASPARDK